MNQKELSEIRRRIKPDKNSILKIYGCYVNANKDIISNFDTSLGLMGEEEQEMYLKIIKKAISGTLGKNLLDIEFTTQQVEEGEEHRLLMKLKSASLNDEDARNELYNRIISCVDFEESNYLILLAADNYDVTYKGSDDECEIDLGAGETHSYFICAICPVKASALQLKYNVENGKFNSMATGQIAASPELGFMFPAFDDRSSNIYNALYYTRKPAEVYQGFVDSIFAAKPVMSAPKQKYTFAYAMSESLENECSMDVVQAVHEELCIRVEEHKALKIEEPLEITPEDIGYILKENGLEEEKVEAFSSEVKKYFGEDASLNPNNLVDVRKFSVETPEVKISVAAENRHLIETRVIDGRKYILIAADDGVEVNGIPVSIGETEK